MGILRLPDETQRFNVLIKPKTATPIVDAQGRWCVALFKIHEICEARDKLKEKYEATLPKKARKNTKKAKPTSQPTEVDNFNTRLMSFGERDPESGSSSDDDSDE